MADDDGRSFASSWFGIDESDVVWYRSGICYARVCVRTREAAEKVRNKVKNDTVNGGWYHGEPLGYIMETTFNGERVFDVMC